MHVTILLYENMTALDAIGPYEALSHVPGHEVVFVAKQAGPVTVDTGFLQLTATKALSEVERTDVLIIPGGGGSRALMQDEEVLSWVRRIHGGTRYTTSVCTGSLVLAAAGLLEGLEATSHWAYRHLLADYGATPIGERVVFQGKIVTAAGVSAGIDMALTLLARLANEEVAKAVQLAIEYDPQPPFDAGSPEKAGEALVALVRSLE
jgi:putative intracellular protease/amidase